MVHCKYYKGVWQTFSKDPEEETTKSRFERPDWEALDHASSSSQSASMTWWGVRRDEVVEAGRR